MVNLTMETINCIKSIRHALFLGNKNSTGMTNVITMFIILSGRYSVKPKTSTKVKQE